MATENVELCSKRVHRELLPVQQTESYSRSVLLQLPTSTNHKDEGGMSPCPTPCVITSGSRIGHLSLMEEVCVKGLPILPVGFFYLVPETAGTNSIAS